MNRTRWIFFGILAVTLAIVATSLALQLISETTALTLFIASTVFSVGVVAMDFLGVLGGHHGDAGHDFDAGDVAVGHLDVADAGGHVGGDLGAGHFDAGDIGGGGHFGAEDVSGHFAGGDHVADAGGHVDGGHVDGGHVDGGHVAGGHVAGGHAATEGHDDGGDHGEAGHAHPVPGHPHAAPILSVLTYLRLLVYFCLGFGPTGWAGMISGRGALGSLALAAPVGVLALFLAQAFFRFQRHDTDSQIRRQDLLSQTATVLVPLDYKTMGKVRMQVGLSVTEQYALAANPGAEYRKGETVRIVKVTDECVYVR